MKKKNVIIIILSILLIISTSMSIFYILESNKSSIINLNNPNIRDEILELYGGNSDSHLAQGLTEEECSNLGGRFGVYPFSAIPTLENSYCQLPK